MFTIDTPKSFKIGDTIDCRINYEPSKLTWKDADTLVIEPGDPRAILRTRIDGELRIFFCGHAGATKDQYTVDVSNPEAAQINIRRDQIRAVMTKAQQIEFEVIKETSAILVNSATKAVQGVTINGYDGIKKLLGKGSDPEGSTLCQVADDTYLQSWGDCNQYMVRVRR